MQIIRKENELDQMNMIIRNKDQEAEMLQEKCKSQFFVMLHCLFDWLLLADMRAVDAVEVLRSRLAETEQELQKAR